MQHPNETRYCMYYVCMMWEVAEHASCLTWESFVDSSTEPGAGTCGLICMACSHICAAQVAAGPLTTQ